MSKSTQRVKAMRLDVYADLHNLFMLNFSAPAAALHQLVPPPLRLVCRSGRAFPSVVLPCIRNLRPQRTGFPRVNYELFGLRILAEYDHPAVGPMKGIYFAELIMDPGWVRRAANLLTPFRFRRGNVVKRAGEDGVTYHLEVHDAKGGKRVTADVHITPEEPRRLTPQSVFSDPAEALAMYNDIAYGFLPEPRTGKVHVLQIADPHPDYEAWPLKHLEVENVHVAALHDDPELSAGLVLEPCYYLEPLPRVWSWLPSQAYTLAEQVEPAPGATPAG